MRRRVASGCRSMAQVPLEVKGQLSLEFRLHDNSPASIGDSARCRSNMIRFVSSEVLEARRNAVARVRHSGIFKVPQKRA